MAHFLDAPMCLHHRHGWVHLPGIQCFPSHRLCSESGTSLQCHVSTSNPHVVFLVLILLRIILMASICIVLLQLMHIKPLLARYWHYILWVVVMLLFTADLSLVSLGTSNFFNPTASPSLIRSDHAVLKAGVVIGLILNLVFLDVLIAFHLSCSRAAVFAESANRNLKLFVFLLCTIGTMILARNIFRTIQIFSPSDSPAWRVQTYFWVFDACPLLISSLLLNVLHPGKAA
jgi:RTA1 like protein